MRWIITIASLFIANFTFAQSPVFSQYYTTATYLNPALVGSESDITLGLNYRAQWNQIESPYRTLQFTYMHPLLQQGGRTKHTGGVGVSILSDQAGYGSLKSTGINFSGAYNLHLSAYGNNIISFGLQSGIYMNSLDEANLQWGSQYNRFTGFDPSISVNAAEMFDQRMYVVFNTGFLWFYRKQERYSHKEFSTYLGGSVYNLNQPNTSLLGETNRLPISIRAHGGITTAIAPQFRFTPSFLLVNEYSQTQVNAGAYFTYSVGKKNDAALILGAWYRLNDSFIGHLGVEIQGLRVAFSYDHNVSNITRYFGNLGSYEFSLQYRIFRKHRTTYFSTPLI